MPDLSITDAVFDVGITENDQLRTAWQKAKARYAPELRAKEIDFSKGLGPALDKWAKSYKGFKKTVDTVADKKALWTNIKPLTQAALKTDAQALKTDANAVAKVLDKYLDKIDELDDPAKEDLTTILTKIKTRTARHVTSANKVLRAQ